MSNSAIFKMDVNGIVNAVGDDDVATGDIKLWPSDAVPTGWFVRDGRALSRATYAGLFAVLGTKYGAGDGSTTFNIMDDRGEFERCADMGRGIDMGREIGSWQSHETAAHDHQQNVAGGGTGGGSLAFAGLYEDATTVRWGNVRTGQTGGSETRPRNRAYMPLIKY